jgi:hypothetical protein
MLIQVAVLSPNVPAMYELHFVVPMAGARDGNGYPKPEYPTGITR